MIHHSNPLHSLSNQVKRFNMSSQKSKDYIFSRNDLLGRKTSADELQDLVKLMNNCERYSLSLSIAIDSRWGSGKTYFLNMWKNYIRENEKGKQGGTGDSCDKVVYYNAWEFDDSESTLIPIVYSIVKGLDVSSNDSVETIVERTAIEGEQGNEKLKEHMKVILKIIGSAAIKYGFHKLFGYNTELTKILQDGIDQASEEDIKSVLSEFNKYFEYRRNLSNALEALKPSGGKLWVFVDDLDRCKPGFALETLEDIKHFFNIEGIIFVFAVDMNQLSYSVKNAYGDEVNAASYVRKFFDYIYLLPSPDLSNYINGTFKQDKRAPLRENSLEYLCRLYRIYDYSLREINQNISHLYTFLDKHAEIIEVIKNDKRDNADDGIRLYIFFMIIRDKYHYEYKRLITGDFSLTDSSPQKYSKLENYKFINIKINDFLDDISEGGVDNWKERLQLKYKLFNMAVDGTFEKHMESVLS